MILKIRNMVCRHCVEALKRTLLDQGLHPLSVELGVAEIEEENLGDALLRCLDNALDAQGFSRIKSHDEEIAEKTKHVILDHLRRESCPLNLSACLEEHLQLDYPTISRAFQATEGRTIAKYYLYQRIEFVKELLQYGEKTLAEIADLTGFSSAAHLSRQFKAVTGLTTSQYIALRPSRKPLSNV